MIDVDALAETMEMVERAAVLGLHDQSSWITRVRYDDMGNESEVAPAEVTTPDGRTWTCGTAACFAGWRALMDGYEPIDDAVIKHPVTGEAHYTADYAEARLGLTRVEADWLFYPDNSLDDLRTIVAALIQKARHELMEVS